jgi:hypothetical protein
MGKLYGMPSFGLSLWMELICDHFGKVLFGHFLLLGQGMAILAIFG